MLRKAKTNFIRCIGYLSSTKDRIKLDLLPTLALSLQQNCLNYKLFASLLSNLVSLGTMRQCMKGQRKYAWSINNSGKVLSKLKSRGFCGTSLSTFFSNLYTTLLHNLIREKLVDLIVPLKSNTKMKVHFILLVTIGKRFLHFYRRINTLVLSECM